MKTLSMLRIQWLLIPVSISFFQVLSQQTQTITHLDEKLQDNQNILYSSTFRAAWTNLKENVFGEDILLQKPLSIAHQLNKNPVHFDESDQNIYIKSGFIDDGVLDEIIQDLRKNYGIDDAGLDDYYHAEAGIISFALMKKTIGFKYKFQSMDHLFESEGMKTKVAGFGINNIGSETDQKHLLSQVKLYDFLSDQDFIVKLFGDQEEWEIILAKVNLEKTLKETLNKVMMRVSKGNSQRLSFHDELVIPKIRISEITEYKQLYGKHLANKGYETYYFIAALQKINFSMDESGVVANASAEIVLEKKAPKPKHLVFDKPFLLMLKRKDHNEPDLVVYIQNQEFLVPVE